MFDSQVLARALLQLRVIIARWRQCCNLLVKGSCGQLFRQDRGNDKGPTGTTGCATKPPILNPITVGAVGPFVRAGRDPKRGSLALRDARVPAGPTGTGGFPRSGGSQPGEMAFNSPVGPLANAVSRSAAPSRLASDVRPTNSTVCRPDVGLLRHGEPLRAGELRRHLTVLGLAAGSSRPAYIKRPGGSRPLADIRVLDLNAQPRNLGRTWGH